jgi:PhnB protein
MQGPAELPRDFSDAHGANDSEAERRFAALADGGQVQMPLAKTFFSSRFGMVADRFGVSWMIVVRA